jgi:Putative Flp pilus-assembly TadE/G-like
MRRFREERGAVVVVTALFMTVLLGIAAFAIDAGSWYRADRQLQTKVDAAALAGAQELPWDPGLATSTALSYASKNGGGPAPMVTITKTSSNNDTIVVQGSESAPGFFSKVLGVDSVTVGAHARAKVAGLGSAKYVAPLTVSDEHPMLKCVKTKPPASCYGPATLDWEMLKDVPGAFGFITLNGDKNVGSSTLGDWILHGYDQELPANKWYDSVPGAKFDSTEIQSTMQQMIDGKKDMLFPVYSTVQGNGSNGQYYVIGWVVFQPTKMYAKGGKSYLEGIFKGVLWEGAEGSVTQDFGVRFIRLTD